MKDTFKMYQIEQEQDNKFSASIKSKDGYTTTVIKMNTTNKKPNISDTQYTLKGYQTEKTNNFSVPIESAPKGYTRTVIKLNAKKEMPNLNPKIEGALFLAETLKEEVMQGTLTQKKKNAKQLKKLLQQFVAISLMTGVGLSLGILTADPLTASANSLMTTTTTTVNGTVPIDLTPDGIMDWALKIALLLVAVGVGLSMVMFAFVGIYLMITRNKAKALDWNSDIIKGVVQVLVSIPLVYALFQLSQVIFKNLPFLEGLM